VNHPRLHSIEEPAFQYRSVFFSWNWGLNSGLCTCKAGALLLEPHLQSFTHHLPFIHPLFFLKVLSQVPVAPAYNPSYSGGRDQEDQGLKPALESSLQDPISKKKTTQKMGGGAPQV
jgi:hypothetical protein